MQGATYENVRDKDKELFFRISKSVNCPKHFHRNFELLFILDGECKVCVNEKEFVAKKDEIIFVSNYYTHSYTASDNIKKYVLIIPDNMNADFVNKFKNYTLPSHLADHEFNRRIFDILSSEDFNNLPNLSKKGYVLVIFGLLLKHYPSVPIESNSDIETIVNILNYIDENYDKGITLESISSVFGYNKYYFSKLFNRYVRENLTSYINIVRVQNLVKKAVKLQRPNITDLAFEFGFDSLATFYRYFKEVYKCSPTTYLEQMRKHKT